MMRLNIYIVSLLLILTFQVIGQERWSNSYLSGSDPFGEDVIKSYDNGYLLTGRYGPNYPDFTWLIKTNVNGEILWNKTIGISNEAQFFGEIGYTSDGKIYLAGTTYSYSEQSDVIIMKLNTCGEKEWCKVIIEDGYNYATAMVTTPDDGLAVLLAYMQWPVEGDRICLAKFDKDGNLNWLQRYNSADTSLNNEDAYDLTISPDGGFIITGACYYKDPNNPSNSWLKPYYIKTGSNGRFEWETIVLSDESIIGGHGWSTVLSPDSNFYFSSISHYNLSPSGYAPALLKMDLNGNVVDIYDLAQPGLYGRMIEGKFITDSTLVASAIWGGYPFPKAVVIDTIGNIIHQAEMLDNNLMAHTEVTHDKKLLFLTSIHNGNDNYDTYLFKFNQQLESDTNYTQWFNYDSLCPYQVLSDTIVQDGCGIIVGTEEIYPEEVINNTEFLIYPNPASTYFSISKNENLKTIEIRLFNQLGQKVLHEHNKYENIDISVIGQGIYFIEIESNGIITRKKLIIN